MAEELKPCPFCGGTKLNHAPGQIIACMNVNCGGQVDMGAPWGGPKEDGIAFLITAWNTRSEGPLPVGGEAHDLCGSGAQERPSRRAPTDCQTSGGVK